MKPFLNEVNPNDLKSPIMEYEIFRKEKVDVFIENQRNRQLISKVNQLFADQEYSLVNDVLLVNLEIAASSNKLPDLTETRLYHLLMMVETQWNLNNFSICVCWIEQAIHEIMISKNNEIETATPEDLLNLLRTLECCIVMLGMISHKKSLITIFGHKHKITNFIKKGGYLFPASGAASQRLFQTENSEELFSIKVGFWGVLTFVTS